MGLLSRHRGPQCCLTAFCAQWKKDYIPFLLIWWILAINSAQAASGVAAGSQRREGGHFTRARGDSRQPSPPQEASKSAVSGSFMWKRQVHLHRGPRAQVNIGRRGRKCALGQLVAVGSWDPHSEGVIEHNSMNSSWMISAYWVLDQQAPCWMLKIQTHWQRRYLPINSSHSRGETHLRKKIALVGYNKIP